MFSFDWFAPVIPFSIGFFIPLLRRVLFCCWLQRLLFTPLCICFSHGLNLIRFLTRVLIGFPFGSPMIYLLWFSSWLPDMVFRSVSHLVFQSVSHSVFQYIFYFFKVRFIFYFFKVHYIIFINNQQVIVYRAFLITLLGLMLTMKSIQI